MYMVSAVVLIMLAGTGCGWGEPPGPGEGSRPTTLHAALYPWVPDAADYRCVALLARVEREFEARHPDVDLILAPMDKSVDTYDTETVRDLIVGRSDRAPLDVLEVDCVMLPELVAAQLIDPWSGELRGSDWHPAGIRSSTLEGHLFGVPHWLCGWFIVTRDSAIAAAGSASQLSAALQASDPGTANLVGDMTESWDLACQYLDAWADTHGTAFLNTAVDPVLDSRALAGLRAVCAECRRGAANPCIDGTYDDNDDAAKEFGAGRADALLGYSERLHVVRRHDAVGRQLWVSAAPLGEGSHQVVFVDSFVIKPLVRDFAT